MSFDQISRLIDMYDPPFDPPMKEGQPMASQSRVLPEVLPKEQAMPSVISTIGYDDKHFKCERKTYENAHKNASENMMFPEDLATSITVRGITFQSRQGIAVPNNTHKTYQVDSYDK